jgi:hypothetical protein
MAGVRKINGNTPAQFEAKAGTVLTRGIPLIGGLFVITDSLYTFEQIWSVFRLVNDQRLSFQYLWNWRLACESTLANLEMRDAAGSFPVAMRKFRDKIQEIYQFFVPNRSLFDDILP